MIYLDSSVALAHLLAEDRFPPDELWEGQLVSGFLSARSGIVLTRTVCRIRMAVRNLTGRVTIIEMISLVLTRALQLFPVPVRTPDAIHLTALEFIRAQKLSVQRVQTPEQAPRVYP